MSESATATQPKIQSTAQLPLFAAEMNRKLAKKLIDSPKVTLAAAVLAFGTLDPEIQVDLIAKARAEILRQ
ncbi:hypothetical protein VT84_30825 [Gemmata sp. SH-PL17]|uniref:hypothetical protein n=1 Tax=Gemmata sp. SH-PL17 TaxID=1630693 RepID=UPI00078D8C96|nr:hypothetical protein [Gemmata sp. SH-PL17]AMV28828.1 hypothetical protein VT84_30825 [Gemmata sp. SH-PL17]